jgi:hypothetical protein
LVSDDVTLLSFTENPPGLPAVRLTFALPPGSRLLGSQQRLALGLLLLVALIVTVVLLLVILPSRPIASGGTSTPWLTSRAEMGSLEQLAKTSAAQSAALTTERDQRRRAEEDLALKDGELQRSLEEKIRLGHNGFQPWCLAALGGNRIPQRQNHAVELGMELASLTNQIEPIAAFQIIGTDQQLVRLVSFRRQIAQTGLLIGDGAGDAGIPPEAAAQGPQQEATFGRHRDPAWYFHRFQPFLRGAVCGIGQKGREIHALGIAPWQGSDASK